MREKSGVNACKVTTVQSIKITPNSLDDELQCTAFNTKSAELLYVNVWNRKTWFEFIKKNESSRSIEEMQIAICILYERKMFWHINLKFPHFQSNIQALPLLFFSLLQKPKSTFSHPCPFHYILSDIHFKCSLKNILSRYVWDWVKWRRRRSFSTFGFIRMKITFFSLCRFNLDKRFEYKCSWKIFSIALIFLSVILTVLLAYFASKYLILCSGERAERNQLTTEKRETALRGCKFLGSLTIEELNLEGFNQIGSIWIQIRPELFSNKSGKAIQKLVNNQIEKLIGYSDWKSDRNKSESGYENFNSLDKQFFQTNEISVYWF